MLTEIINPVCKELTAIMCIVCDIVMEEPVISNSEEQEEGACITEQNEKDVVHVWVKPEPESEDTSENSKDEEDDYSNPEPETVDVKNDPERDEENEGPKAEEGVVEDDGMDLYPAAVVETERKRMTDKDAVEMIARSNAAFCHSLYKVLKQEQQQNIIFSPLSAQLVLMMAYIGAKEKTAHEMEAALQLPQDQKLTLTGVQALLEVLKSSERLTLDVVNKIFIQEDFTIKVEFQKIIQDIFQSGVQLVNFREHPGEASSTINDWVREKTRDKIQNIVKESEIHSDSKMILINAVYFKSKWLSKFSVAGSKPFHMTSTKTSPVTMITKTATYNYAQLDDLKSQVVELRYQGEQVSMLILLPNEVEGLSNLEEKLPTISLSAIYNQLKYESVFVTMPKFKLEETIDLNDSLMKLGMKTMFSNDANFSGISEEVLKVSKVLQKAFISVDEYGTEAAAATYVHMVGCCAPMEQKPPEVFNADHPFMFALVNQESGTVLFLGVFVKP
ncbi:serpin B4-like isoform X3 [Anabrus simplex]|uniref:serpin B4-like isoform X3 n=1 Tax=Anabrus simplex TaxID=316456 RepID=UPI0035A2CF2D